MIESILILLVINFLVTLYVLHRIRRVHLMTYRISEEVRRIENVGLIGLHQQLQSLHTLHAELGLEKGLPATRGWSASPDFLLVVLRHARRAEPMVVVECGSGASTVVLARSLQLNGKGHLYSLEHQAEHAAATKAELDRHDLSSWASIILAPLVAHELNGETWSWYDDEELPDTAIEMLVIDGPPLPEGPMIRYPAGPRLFPRLAPGAVVFLDDATREDEQLCLERWSREFAGSQRQDHDCEKGCASLTWKANARPGTTTAQC